MSILPNVLEVASRNHLEADSKTLGKKEVRFKCPFCLADSNRKGKYYLSLNQDKNVFKCWYCKESGGVLRFISLLEEKSEQDLIEEIRQKNGSSYKKHPAERLTRHQLELIGYPKIDWVANRNFDYQLYKSYRERVWKDWKAYVARQKELAYKLLFVGLLNGEFKKSIEQVKEIEKEVNETFLDNLVKHLFKEKKSDELFRVELFACHIAGRDHPYETIHIIKNQKGEDYPMINKCVFVGRLASEVDMRYTPNGKAVANFTLALTRSFTDQNGDRQADFVRCVVWNKTAENMAKQLSKGDLIAIEARVQTRTYEGQDGKTNYVTEFVVEGLPQFLKVKKWQNGNGNANHTMQNQGQPNQNQPFDPFNQGGQSQPHDISDDDLPF